MNSHYIRVVTKPCNMKLVALARQGVSEKMFDYYGHMHVYIYSPGAGANNPLRTFFFP